MMTRMNLHAMLVARAAAQRPLRVVLIGAGKFGSMYLAQAKHTPGIHVVAVADLDPDRARASLSRVGWQAERYGARSLAEAARHSPTTRARRSRRPKPRSSSTPPGIPPPGSGTRSHAACTASTW